MSGQTTVSTARRDRRVRLAGLSAASWTSGYLRRAAIADGTCALLAGLLAYQVRFENVTARSAGYLLMSLGLPVAWLATVALAGGYDSRFIGVGTDEFRKICSAGAFLTATVAIVAYGSKTDLARGYVVIATRCAGSAAACAGWWLSVMSQ